MIPNNRIDFERKYLGRKVKVKLKVCFLEPTQTWILEEDEFIGILEKEEQCIPSFPPKIKTYYFISPHDKEGKLRNSCFRISDFERIELL